MLEIEKKYLLWEDGVDYTPDDINVHNLKNQVLSVGDNIEQGYLPLDIARRLCEIIHMDISFIPSEYRLRNKNSRYFFTVKDTGDLIRNELEVEIDASQFFQFWNYTEHNRIKKVRSTISKNKTFEIDVYIDRDLIIAEVELSSVAELFERNIKLIGKDVTSDPDYKNKNLAF